MEKPLKSPIDTNMHSSYFLIALNSATETSFSYLHHNSFYISCFIKTYTNQNILVPVLCLSIVFNDNYYW